jgi:hypothetical protein
MNVELITFYLLKLNTLSEQEDLNGMSGVERGVGESQSVPNCFWIIALKNNSDIHVQINDYRMALKMCRAS